MGHYCDAVVGEGVSILNETIWAVAGIESWLFALAVVVYSYLVHIFWREFVTIECWPNRSESHLHGVGINWRSPTYASGSQNFPDTVTVWLHDVLEAGLVIKEAPNLPANAAACPGLNAKAPYTCAWAAIQFNDKAATWVNASVSLGAEKQTLVLVAEAVPTGATKAVATSYGWGAIPMLNVYRADMDGEDGQLPVLPWNRTLAPGWA